jgi:hypothetical protein
MTDANHLMANMGHFRAEMAHKIIDAKDLVKDQLLNMVGNSGVISNQQLPPPRMTMLHRLYWAVLTGRESVVDVFWALSGQPLVASFLVSYTASLLLNIKSQPSKRDALHQLIAEYNTRAVEVLDRVETKEEAFMILESYLFVLPPGADEQPQSSRDVARGPDAALDYEFDGVPEFFCIFDLDPTVFEIYSKRGMEYDMQPNEKHQKALGALPAWHRKALGLYTTMDLAICAGNQNFLSHDYVQAFLDSVWYSAKGYSSVFGRNFTVRHAFIVHAFFHFVFLAAWAQLVLLPPQTAGSGYSLLQLVAKHDTTTFDVYHGVCGVYFGLYCLAHLEREYSQLQVERLVGNFSWGSPTTSFSSWWHYLKRDPIACNTNDLSMTWCIVLMSCGAIGELSTDEGTDARDQADSLWYFWLCATSLPNLFNLLNMSKIFKSFGVLAITTGKIVTKDVVPWTLFTAW